MLIRVCTTRFLTLFLVIARLRAVKDSIINVVRSTKFDRLVDSAATKTIKDDAAEVNKFTESTEFWSKLDFAYDLLSCVMRAARFFDTSSQVAAVHVYSMWSMLPESFKVAMAKHPRLMASNRDFYASVADLLVDR